MSRQSAGFELQHGRTPVRALLSDIWASRDLIAVLSRKDFYVRYRRASFGMLWAVGLPVFQASVMAIVFSRVVRIDVGVSYAAFLFSGIVGWAFFSQVLAGASTAIVDGSSLTNRIYFPRAVLPIVTVMSNFYGFVVTVAVMLALNLILGVHLGVDVLWIVPAIALLVALTTSLALLNSALHVYFRDMRYVVTAVIQPWFYLTPILYPASIAPRGIRAIVRLNPATGFVELFRAATVGADSGWVMSVVASCIWTVAFAAIALVLHSRYDREFADLL